VPGFFRFGEGYAPASGVGLLLGDSVGDVAVAQAEIIADRADVRDVCGRMGSPSGGRLFGLAGRIGTA